MKRPWRNSRTIAPTVGLRVCNGSVTVTRAFQNAMLNADVHSALIAIALLAAHSAAAAAPAASRPDPSPSTATTPSATPPAAPDFPTPTAAVTRRVNTLIEALRQTEGLAERGRILDDLVEIGPPALPLFVAELDRRSRETWPAMIYALGAVGDPRVIPILRRNLSHQTGTVYMDVLYALTLAGDPEAPRQALRSSFATVSLAPDMTAMDYIAGALGPAATPMLIREIPRRSQEARIAGLGALGTICDAEAVPFLLEWSRRPESIDRRCAVMALARIGDPRSGPRLVEALADPDASVQEAAVEGVGYLREARALPALIQLARRHPASTLRRRAYWSLGLIGGPDAAATLIAALGTAAAEDEHTLVIRALGQTGAAEAAEPLAKETLGASPIIAVAAVTALQALPDAAARDRLLTACSEAPVHEAGLEAARALVIRRDPRVAPCAIKQLREEIDRRHGLDPAADDMLELLPLAAPASVAASLEVAADAVAAPALQHRLREAAHLTRMMQELGAGVEPWIKLLDEGDASEVDLAIRRLGDMGDAQAVEPLVRVFGRIDPDRAWRIPEALGRIGSERATAFLISLLTDDLYHVPSLERAREEAARALARYARAPHAADANREAFVAEQGRLFVPIMAYARMRGAAGIPDLLELKRLLLRRRGPAPVLRHEKINWAIRMLRTGREIPLSEVSDAQ